MSDFDKKKHDVSPEFTKWARETGVGSNQGDPLPEKNPQDFHAPKRGGGAGSSPAPGVVVFPNPGLSIELPKPSKPFGSSSANLGDIFAMTVCPPPSDWPFPSPPRQPQLLNPWETPGNIVVVVVLPKPLPRPEIWPDPFKWTK